jgi:ribonuclease P protein component
MLPKEYRLSKPVLLSVLSRGKRVHTNAIVSVAISSTDTSSRFAIIVPKKKGMTAVRRNRIKRLIRQAIVKTSSHLKKPTNIVFLVRDANNWHSVTDVISHLHEIFIKLSSYHD